MSRAVARPMLAPSSSEHVDSFRMDITELLSGSFSNREPQLDIAPGERVRSYDFAGVEHCYAEGVVEEITEPREGCRRYKVRVERRVFDGREIAPDAPHVYPPVNGTQSLMGGRTNLVERVTP